MMFLSVRTLAHALFIPLTISCPGNIQASATWEGTADALALILNGPGQVGYFARVDGAKPLVLRYSISC